MQLVAGVKDIIFIYHNDFNNVQYQFITDILVGKCLKCLLVLGSDGCSK